MKVNLMFKCKVVLVLKMNRQKRKVSEKAFDKGNEKGVEREKWWLVDEA